ncbi:MAG: DJ-1/PfpI family protein [Halobacteriales archaeon]
MEAVFVAFDGFDARERLYVVQRLREEDVTVKFAVAGEDVHDSEGEPLVSDVDLEDEGVYDLVHVSDGNPADDELKRGAEFVRRNSEEGAFVTAVGEGVRVLVKAGVAEDRQVAAAGETADAVEEEGGRAYDEPVVVDAKFVTARGGDDLPVFGGDLVRKLRRARVKDL